MGEAPYIPACPERNLQSCATGKRKERQGRQQQALTQLEANGPFGQVDGQAEAI